MSDTDYASFDPIFWLHHCYIDYVLDQWWSVPNHTVQLKDFGNRTTLPFTLGSRAFHVWDAFSQDTPSETVWTITQPLLGALKLNENVQYVPTRLILSVPPITFPSFAAVMAAEPRVHEGEAETTIAFAEAQAKAEAETAEKHEAAIVATRPKLGTVKVDRSKIGGSFAVILKDNGKEFGMFRSLLPYFFLLRSSYHFQQTKAQ